LNKKIYDAFVSIKADDSLKASTVAYLRDRINGGGEKQAFRFRYVFSAVMALLIIIGGTSGYSLSVTPVSYISIDVNPSLELVLNRYDKVLSAIAYNGDAEMVLAELDLKHLNYQEAINTLLESEAFSKYLSEDALVSFAVVSDREEEILAGIEQCQSRYQYEFRYGATNRDTMDEAHENRMSFGKYQAYLELAQYDSSLTSQDCQNLTMRQINDLINQYQGGAESPSGNGNENDNDKVNDNAKVLNGNDLTGNGQDKKGGHN